jgi:hypothetical protein
MSINVSYKPLRKVAMWDLLERKEVEVTYLLTLGLLSGALSSSQHTASKDWMISE